MQTAVTLAEIKDWLYLPAATDTTLDAKLTGLLVAACNGIEDVTDLTLAVDDADAFDPTVAPDRIKTAIKFRVATWYENPVPDAASEASAQTVVNNLIAKYRVLTYPAFPYVASISPTTGSIAGGTSVTITGKRFDRDHLIVRFGCIEATDVVVVSDTEITCSTPAGVAGVVNVTVVNGGRQFPEDRLFDLPYSSWSHDHHGREGKLYRAFTYA
jgi:hypothetical protein